VIESQRLYKQRQERDDEPDGKHGLGSKILIDIARQVVDRLKRNDVVEHGYRKSDENRCQEQSAQSTSPASGFVYDYKLIYKQVYRQENYEKDCQVIPEELAVALAYGQLLHKESIRINKCRNV
jgi:hypothetical protein